MASTAISTALPPALLERLRSPDSDSLAPPRAVEPEAGPRRHVLYVVYQKVWYTDEAYTQLKTRVPSPVNGPVVQAARAVPDGARGPWRNALMAIASASVGVALGVLLSRRKVP